MAALVAVSCTAALALALPARADALNWLLPASDFTTASDNAFGLQTAVSGDGTVTAVWFNADAYGGGTPAVQLSTRPAGQATFGATVNITLAGDSPQAPQVASAPDGTTTVVWAEGSTGTVMARTRPPGAASFGAPEAISGPGPVHSPQVTVGADGATTVVWAAGAPASQWVVKAATREAGAAGFPDPSVTPPDVLSVPEANIYAPRVAIGPDRTTAVAWSADNGAAPYFVRATVRNAGQAHFPDPGSSPPQTLSTPGQSSLAPWVAVGPAGEVTTTWTNISSSPSQAEAATREAGAGSFAAPELLSTAPAGGSDAQVAYGPQGDAIAVWTNDVVQTSTRPAGSGGFGAPVDLSAPVGYYASSPQLKVAPDGEATAVWWLLGSPNVIETASRPPGSGASWSARETIATPDLASIPSLGLVVAATGQATATWLRSPTSPFIGQVVSSGTTSYALSVATDGTGSGSVGSEPSGISCGSACSARFVLSTPITLTATPGSGSTFAGWGGACSGTSTTCRVVLLGDRSVTATFTKEEPGPTPGPTPSSNLRVTSSRARGSSVVTRVRVPGPGRIRQRGTYRTARAGSATTHNACTASSTAGRAGTYTLTCPLNSAARKQRRKGALRVAVRTTFTPTGGTARSTVRTVVFRSLKPNYTG